MRDERQPEAPPSPALGRCLALYPRLSRHARRRMAALLVATTLLAPPLAGQALGQRASGGAGGNFRAPIAPSALVLPPGEDGARSPYAIPAVRKALRGLGLDAPAALAGPAAMDATPAGSEFQVNTYTVGIQGSPAVAMDTDGDFVVVWMSNGSGGTDASSFSIQGQRFNSVGRALGSEFQVNTYTMNDQISPAVAMYADGDFVVVWMSNGSGGTDTSGYSIQGQRYDAVGRALGSQFQVNTYTTNSQRDPAVAMDADGDFVVVWQGIGPSGTDTNFAGIQGQRYNSVGTARGGQFQVHAYTTQAANHPAVAIDVDGDFVVVWASHFSSMGGSSDNSIQGQRFDAAGTAQGNQFQVNTYAANSLRHPDSQDHPVVAMDADGDFVVAWHGRGQDGGDADLYSIQGQRFDAAGTVQGSQFQVNTYTTGQQIFPSVTMGADGDFAVVWQSFGSGGTDTSGFSIQGQRYNLEGTAQDHQFQVNTYAVFNQLSPAVAMDANGDFAVAWTSHGSGGTDTSGDSVQAQRYTAVDQSFFRAIGLAHRAILVWETVREVDTLGFQVLRAADAGGTWTPVGPALIPAEGGVASGHTYVLHDTPGPGAWHYRLEVVDAGGKRSALSAIEVRVGTESEGREIFMPRVDIGWPGGT